MEHILRFFRRRIASRKVTPMATGSKKNTMSDLAKSVPIPLITAAAAFFAAWLSFAENEKNAQIDLLEIYTKRIEELEKQVFKQAGQITQLRIQNAAKYDDARSLANYLESMPYAAWIKIVDADENGNPRFTMAYINRVYEQRFSVTKLRYHGRTDFEVWEDKETAKSFYENDKKVLNKLDHRCVEEVYQRSTLDKDSGKVSGYVCKWPTRYNGQLAIAGMSLEKIDVKQGK